MVRHESTGVSQSPRDQTRTAVLSGVAGFVDAAGLVSVLALFPAHITGELVSEAAALSLGRHDSGPSRLWMLPAFVLAVALAAVIARVERRAGRAPLPTLLLLVASALGAFAFSGFARIWAPNASPVTVTRIGACCAVAAMGFQNALMRESLSGSAPTTFMTGNLTQLVIELVDHLFHWSSGPGAPADVERSVSRARLRAASIAVSSFLFCAVLGAVLTRSVGALGALVPALLVAWLSHQAYRERHERLSLSSSPAPAETAGPVQSELGTGRRAAVNQPLQYHPRSASGTRIKAVRFDDGKKTSEG